jgi:hypothetical protein
VCYGWKEKMGGVLKVEAIVLDSSPGNLDLKEAWAAMSLGLPRGLLRYPAAAAMVAVSG